MVIGKVNKNHRWLRNSFIVMWALVVNSIVIFSLSAKSPIVVEILTDDDYPPYSYRLDGKAQGSYVDVWHMDHGEWVKEYLLSSR